MSGKLYVLRQRAITVMVEDDRKPILQERAPWYALLLAIISSNEMSSTEILEAMGMGFRKSI